MKSSLIALLIWVSVAYSYHHRYIAQENQRDRYVERVSLKMQWRKI